MLFFLNVLREEFTCQNQTFLQLEEISVSFQIGIIFFFINEEIDFQGSEKVCLGYMVDEIKVYLLCLCMFVYVFRWLTIEGRVFVLGMLVCF